MALIECPECARQISSQALACPGCGFPTAPTATEHADSRTVPESTAPNRQGRLTTRKKWAILLFLLAGWGAFYAVVSSLAGMGSPNSSIFGAVSGGVDFGLKVLLFVGIPFFFGMGLWGGPRQVSDQPRVGDQRVMLVGGGNTGVYIYVDPQDTVAQYDGDLYRRNDHDLFLHIG